MPCAASGCWKGCLKPAWKAEGREEHCCNIEEHIRCRHPEVILESCAGGGNRIDLTALQRRHTIWVSDQIHDPQIIRFHLEGLNQFIPGTGQLIGVTLATQLARQPGFVLPDTTCKTWFAGAMGLHGRLHVFMFAEPLPGPGWLGAIPEARRRGEVFLRLRLLALDAAKQRSK